jgi:hypothetical protein
MNYFRFAMYNVIGGIAWVLICIAAGHFFGQFEFVKKHFEAVIIMIIIISVLPMIWELWQAKRAAKRGGDHCRRDHDCRAYSQRVNCSQFARRCPRRTIAAAPTMMTRLSSPAPDVRDRIQRVERVAESASPRRSRG